MKARKSKSKKKNSENIPNLGNATRKGDEKTPPPPLESASANESCFPSEGPKSSTNGGGGMWWWNIVFDKLNFKVFFCVRSWTLLLGIRLGFTSHLMLPGFLFVDPPVQEIINIYNFLFWFPKNFRHIVFSLEGVSWKFKFVSCARQEMNIFEMKSKH